MCQHTILSANDIAIQGVGETLRGAVNNTADTRFARSDPEKAAYANAKNQATLEQGDREMAGLRDHANLGRTTVSPSSQYYSQPPDTFSKQPSATYQGGTSNNEGNSYTALPQMRGRNDYPQTHKSAVLSDPAESSVSGSSFYDANSTSGYNAPKTTYEANPATSAGYNAGNSSDDGGKRRFNKLMKRKPVAGR